MTKWLPIIIIFFTYVAVEICKVTGIVCGPAFQRIFELSHMVGMLGICICLILVCKLLKPVIRTAKERSESQRNGNFDQNVHTQNLAANSRYTWLWMVLLGFCHGTMIVPLAAWANPMVQDKFTISDFKGAIVFAMLASGLALGRLTLAIFKFKADNRTLLVFSGIAGGILLAASLLSSSYVFTILLVALGGLVASSTAPCILSIVPIKFPYTKPHLYGYVGASISAAALIAPSLVGILADCGLSIDQALLISPAAAWTLGITALLWKIKDRRCTTK